jgi:pilus assembly protein Flp/PilA
LAAPSAAASSEQLIPVQPNAARTAGTLKKGELAHPDDQGTHFSTHFLNLFFNFSFKAIQMNKLFSSIRSFAIEEDGAQVIEYALIIAVVSIALVVALRALTTSGGGSFSSFIGRVANCLTTSSCQ